MGGWVGEKEDYKEEAAATAAGVRWSTGTRGEKKPCGWVGGWVGRREQWTGEKEEALQGGGWVGGWVGGKVPTYLDLAGVQVHRDDAVHAHLLQHPGNVSGGDGLAAEGRALVLWERWVGG